MRMNIVSLAALAATAAGLVVTSPRIGEKIDPDQPLTIKWQVVTTDPDTFNIELVNQNVYPPTTEVVAQDVDSSSGSYTVKAKSFTGVDTGKGYQINFLSPDNGILAQSQQFRVTEPGELASSSGKETSTALETSSISASSLLSSTVSTSDLTSLFNNNTFNLFFRHSLNYPDHFYFPNYFYSHNHIFYLNYTIHILFHLDFHKHYLFYITFHPHLLHCLNSDFHHHFD
ncbi:hypothetical protein N7457_008113 [Penicillium paradoxum]|uniref:uncharacterized protein n=1 Tax=Penicillium paradoxum TaxID=176176 RepID=UPI0025471C1B|nr:uncharacterized protein N7457_008113 [Penicillium paradoxum]KAJ5773217.1 hypothetical protein N7457_008113 [Penicillium paradoxum]